MDDFGRRLAYLFTTNGSSIDALMIGEGLAKAWTRDGQHSGTLLGLEIAAKVDGIGCLWGEGNPDRHYF